MRHGNNIEALIIEGETAQVEFKSTLRFDLETGNVNKELTKAVAKTIAGFLNKDGGTLLIGVTDERQVCGIGEDISSLRRQNTDGFEQHLRLSLGNYLGVEVTPSLAVIFQDCDGLTVACVSCPAWHEPVFLKDGDRQRFFVRDGNLTKPLDVRPSHEYINRHWTAEPSVTQAGVKSIITEALRELLPAVTEASGDDVTVEHGDLEDDAGAVVDEASVAETTELMRTSTLIDDGGEAAPPWLRVATRRVLNLFLGQLASSQGWKRLYIISPWISELTEGASLPFDLLLRRLEEYGTTVYVVTRPPVEAWHATAVARLAETRRANIAYVPDLHVKLYTALTNQGAFAMLGSANFTQQSLINREIGLLVNAYLEGKRVVKDLNSEASQIYRMPGRTLAYQADFRGA